MLKPLRKFKSEQIEADLRDAYMQYLEEWVLGKKEIPALTFDEWCDEQEDSGEQG